MAEPNFIILYVDNPMKSAAFYGELLGKTPVESSPTFAMFALNSGVMLGLWSKHTVEPKAITCGGGAEIALCVANQSTVETYYQEWKNRGLIIAQTPTQMDFGYTFVALDPDSHRLRVFATP